MNIFRKLWTLLPAFIVSVLCIVSYKYSSAQDGNMVSYISTRHVIQIAEDGNYLWLATLGGLVKYDKQVGHAIATYNTSNSGIPTNLLDCITVDKQGNVWMGCEKGVLKFSTEGVWTVYPNEEIGLSYLHINAIATDAFGNIWTGNQNGGVMFDGSNWHILTPDEIGFNLVVLDIIPDDSGNVWFAQGSDIVQFDGEQWILYTNEDMGVPFSFYPELSVDFNGDVWVLYGEFLLRFDGTTWTQFYTGTASSNSTISCGPDSLVWCSFGSEVLYSFNGNEWIRYELLEIPHMTQPNDLFVTDDGILLIGADNGLYKLDDEVITSLSISQVGFTNNWIKDIEIDASGKKWITDNYLYSYDSVWKYHPNSVDRFNKLKFDLNGILWVAGDFDLLRFNGSFETVYSYSLWPNVIAIGPSNEKWVGSGYLYSGGSLSWYDENTWIHYNSDNSTVCGAVKVINTEENGTVWLCDSYSIMTFNGEEWVTYSTDNCDIPFDIVTCMAFNNGYKYFGSYGAGIEKFDGDNWTVIDTSNSPLTDDDILCLNFDSEGNLWIGTFDGGLFCTDGEQWWNLNMDNSSLPSNCINDIEFEGNIKWIATSSGLVSYDGMGVLLSKREPVEISQIKIYPNPADESIHFNIPEGKYMISIINPQGTIVQTTVATSNMLDISSLSPGMYCIRILSEDECYSSKFIKK